MCTVLLPLGVNPIAVNKYIISYIIFWRHCCCLMWQEPLNQWYIAEDIYSWYSIIVSHSIHNTEYLLQEFREEFDKFGLLLTVQLGLTSYIEDSYDLPAVSQCVHYMFALCSAYYNSWKSTEPYAPLYPRYDDDILNVVRIHKVRLVLSKPFCLCLCYWKSIILYMTHHSLMCVPWNKRYNSFKVL